MNLSDDALFSRLSVIEFQLSFKDNPDPDKPYERLADSNLADRFKTQSEGILNWAIQCCVYYHENPILITPPEMVVVKETYREHVNIYLAFANATYEGTDSDGDRVLKNDAWESFVLYFRAEMGPQEKLPKRRNAIIELDKILVRQTVADGRAFYTHIQEK